MANAKSITAPPPRTEIGTERRSISLDIIRVLAAFLVLLHHWFAGNVGGFYSKLVMPYSLEWVPTGLSLFLKSGFLGVDVFFILSGIVIGKSAIGKTWEVFVGARFLRLWPTYVMSILTAIPIVAFLIRDITPVSATLLSLTGFQWLFGLPTPVGPAWTLFLEIHFYTLIAVAIRIFGPLSQTKLRTLLAAWLGLLLIAPSLHLDAFNFLIDSEFGVYFVFGAVLGTSNLGTWSNFRVGLPLFFIAGIAALVRFQARASAEMPVWFALVAAILTLGSMVFLVFLSSIKKNPRVSRFKSTLVKSISTLGLMTYPVYLFHEQVGMLLVSRLAPALGSGIAMAVSLIFLLGFCLVIVKIYEPWARKALRQFFGLPEARRDSRV